jgi:hypothetical protein
MSRVLQTVAAALLWLSAAAYAGLANPNDVDIVRVAPQDGQLYLYVVLDERIDNRASAGKLHKKLNTYARYSRSGRAYKDEPKANASLPAILVVRVPKPVEAPEMQNLTGIQKNFVANGVRVEIEPFDPPKTSAASKNGT